MLVSPYFPPHLGGVEAYVDGLARAVSRLPGWRVVIITTGTEKRISIVETLDGIRIYRLPALVRISYTPVDPRWPLQIARIIVVEQPDYINVHTPVPGLADAAVLVSGDVPIIVTYHATRLTKPGKRVFNYAARLYGVIEMAMIRRARLVLGVSEHVADMLRGRYGVNVAVFENAVDGSVIRAPRAQDERDVDVVFLARLDPTHSWKGLDQLLQAVSSYASSYSIPLKVLVIGDGTNRPHYELLARQLEISDAVRFAGSLTGDEKFAAISSARTLVACPTSANDAFPTVMLEAWASGVPVVATAIGPLPSLIQDGVNGLLVSPGQPGELADAIHQIVADPDLAARLARGASARVQTGYTWDYRARQLVDMLETLDGSEAQRRTPSAT
jgi:rhamnosyl/mannosyltransferase